MNLVTSGDGTPIAYDRLGEGPAIILVSGAIQHRRRTVEGQTHEADPSLLAPHLLEVLHLRLPGHTSPLTIDRR